MLVVKNLSKFIGLSESITVEWKESLSDTKGIMKSISAFSNTEGGKIVVGVSEKDGSPVGVQIGKGAIENLVNVISQHTDPKVHPRITVSKIEDKDIIVIEVKQSSHKPVLSDGVPYVRVGKSSMKMSKDDHESLILEKHKERLQFDKEICKHATLEDLDKNKIKWYLNKREEIRKIKKPKDMLLDSLLISIGAAQRTGDKIVPTNAGILFFGNDPKRFFIQSQLRIAKFKGTKVTHPVIDRLDSAGTIWEMAQGSEDFIRKDIRLLSFRTDKSFMREDKFEYPIRALREAIINALIHRDYREVSDTRVFLFDNRIEIISPGTFPKGVTPEKPVHKAVNPVLCSLMYDIGFIEKYGSGIYLMRDLCKEWGIGKPHYELHPVETKLVFKSQIKESTTVELREGTLEGLNERQKKAIEYIRENMAISRKDYLSFTNISPRQANKDLKDLVRKKIIMQIGKGRSVRYVVHD